MDRAYVQANHVADRYLSGRLSAEEEAEFEAFLVAHPDVADEVELSRRLKLGLGTLRARGELDAIRPSARARSRWRALAIAASMLVIVTAGVLAWLRQQVPAPSIMSAHLQELVSADGSAARVSATYTIARSRSSGADLVIERGPASSIVELRILPDEESPGTFLVELTRTSEAGSSVALASAGPVAPDGHGLLSVFLDSGRVPAGAYRLRVTPLAAGSPAAPSDYRIEVR